MAQYTDSFEIDRADLGLWTINPNELIPPGTEMSESTDFAIDGNRSFEFKLPAQLYSDARVELQHQGDAPDYETFQGAPTRLRPGEINSLKMAVYFPLDNDFDSTQASSIFQHRPTAGGIPPLGVEENDGAIESFNYWSDDYSTFHFVRHYKIGDPGNKRLIELELGHWFYFHFETRLNAFAAGDGYTKLYIAKDNWPAVDDIVVDYTGPNCYNDGADTACRLKTGIYKSSWTNQSNVDASIAAGCNQVHRYIDKVTFGNEIFPFGDEVKQGAKTLLL